MAFSYQLINYIVGAHKRGAQNDSISFFLHQSRAPCQPGALAVLVHKGRAWNPPDTAGNVDSDARCGGVRQYSDVS